MNDFSVHWLDLVVFATLIAGLVLGLMMGFQRIVFRLIQLTIAIALTVYFYDQIRGVVGANTDDAYSTAADVATGIGVFLAAYLLVFFCLWLVKYALHRAIGAKAAEKIDEGIKKTGLRPIDRLFGGILGTTLASIPVALLLAVLYFNPNTSQSNDLRQSVTAPVAFEAMDEIVAAIPDHHKQRIAATAGRAKSVFFKKAGRWIGDALDLFRERVDKEIMKEEESLNETTNSNDVTL